ncbi:unnamed protein product [Cylicocyclus nassatus]|uniref:Uncharacterized protein n=1 Tax=Cylicocyclus nassatus TaxID=53992 RepID=A0AA36MCB9_CYLNA|nr:unnamed protein product [Cylicocyclus nassatus]
MNTEDRESFNEEMSFMVEEVRQSRAATTLMERFCFQRSENEERQADASHSESRVRIVPLSPAISEEDLVIAVNND